MSNERLTGYDYITRDFLELESHPDFNVKAYQIAVIVSAMTTDQLNIINLDTLIKQTPVEPLHELFADCWCLPHTEPIEHNDGSIDFIIVHNRITEE